MNLDDVKNSLDKNSKLTEDFKNNLFELVILFHNQFKDHSLELLTKRLETLNVEVVSKFISNEPAVYNEKNNLLQINKNKLEETENVKHILMVAILHIATLNDNDEKGLLATFRDGFANIIADNLVGSVE